MNIYRLISLSMLCLSLFSQTTALAQANPYQFYPNNDLDEANQACVISLCGTQNPLAHPFEINPELAEGTKVLVQHKLQKNIESYMGRLIRQFSDLDRSIKNLKSVKDIELTKQQQSFLLAYSYILRISDLYPTLEMSGSKYVFNKEKLKSILTEASPEEISAVSNLASVYMSLISLYSYNNYDYEVLLKILYNTQDVKIAQQTEAAIAQQRLRNFSQILPLSYLYLNENDIVLNKAATGQSLTSAEKKYFMNLSLMARTISIVSQEQTLTDFSKIPTDSNKIKDFILQKYESSDLANTFKSPEHIKLDFKNQFNQCIEKISSAYGALPSNEQLQNFKILFEDVKKQSQTLAEEKVQQNLPNLFNLEVSYPDTKNQALENWKSNIDILINQYDANYSKLKKSTEQESIKNSHLLILTSLFVNRNIFGEAKAFCDRTEPAFLSDSAIAMYNTINLSWPTIIHPEIGLGIVAHELGHIASSRLPGFLDNEKNCLAEKSGSTQYNEEDFADLFSSEVMNRINEKNPLTNNAVMGCGLLQYDQTNKKYLNLTLNNLNLSDTHSSGFYRLLSIASMTNKLTPVCQERLSQLKETRFTAFCKWKK